MIKSPFFSTNYRLAKGVDMIFEIHPVLKEILLDFVIGTAHTPTAPLHRQRFDNHIFYHLNNFIQQ